MTRLICTADRILVFFAVITEYIFYGGKIMGIWELFAIALGLSADAFAVAVCKGLSVEKLK